MVNGDQSHLAQPVTLHPVVYNVAKTVKAIAFGQLLLSLLDGGSDTKAEAATVVYFYL